MKRNIIKETYLKVTTMAMASLVLFSCNGLGDIASDGIPDAAVRRNGSLRVNIEQLAGVAASPTKVDINSSTAAMSWTVGDQIAYCVTNGSSTGYNISNVNTATSDMDVNMAGGYYRDNYAIYPASSRGVDYATPTVVYPDTYSLDANATETYSPCPMVADNTQDVLSFYHVGSLLRLYLSDIPEGTSYVTVAFTGPSYVTGTFTVSNPGTNSALTTVSSGSRSYVTFTKTSWGETQYINVPLPSGISVTAVTVTAYNGSSESLSSKQRTMSWSMGRAKGKKLSVSMDNSVPTFGGLLIAAGPLYYNGSSYEIKDDWNYSSYNSVYGVSNGSTYFNFVQMGQLFESAGFSTSSGSIENNLDPFDGWRLPTNAEWATIIGTTRDGSTVNGNTAKHYALVQLTGVGHAGTTTPTGLLLFPDGKTITGKALSNIDNTTVNSGMTSAELDVYLGQGCAFLPCSGYCSVSFGSGSWYSGGSYGRYWSSTEDSSSLGYYLFFSSGYLYAYSSYGMSSYYFPVRLVQVS